MLGVLDGANRKTLGTENVYNILDFMMLYLSYAIKEELKPSGSRAKLTEMAI